MGVNVYLKEEIKESEGFEEKEESGGKPTQHWTTFHFKGIRLSFDNGVYTLYLHELEDEVPDCLTDFVTGISVKEGFPARPARKLGIYEHEGASAKLDVNMYHREEMEVWITGDKMESVRALYYLIRSGKTQPKESWSEEQEEETSEEDPPAEAAQ